MPDSLAISQTLVSVEMKDDTPDAKDCQDPHKAGKGPRPDISSVTTLVPAEQSVVICPDGRIVPGPIRLGTPPGPESVSSDISFGKVQAFGQPIVPVTRQPRTPIQKLLGL